MELLRETIGGILVCLTIGYLIGSLSPSYLLGRLRGYDIRSEGSGNAGASNTVIMAGKLAGLLVAVLDILKAACGWWISAALFPSLRHAGLFGGTAAVLGHIYPLFLNFRGGKGLACLGGIVLAHDPRALLCLFGVALLIGIITNYVCIVTVSMSVIWPLYYAWTVQDWPGMAVLLLPALPIFLRHRSNFRRLAEGKELRLSYLWKKEEELRRIGKSEL